MGELLFELVGQLVIELILWPSDRSENEEGQ